MRRAERRKIWLKTSINVRNVAQCSIVKRNGNSIIAQHIPGTPARLAGKCSLQRVNLKLTIAKCTPRWKSPKHVRDVAIPYRLFSLFNEENNLSVYEVHLIAPKHSGCPIF
jgi:hypothetical protein